MEISFTIIFSFLCNYLLAITVCFIGSFVRESYYAMTYHKKMRLIRIVLNSIVGAFLSCFINKFVIVRLSMTMEIEFFMMICLLIGLWSNNIMRLVTDKSIFITIIQTLISKCLGKPGEAFVEAWKSMDEEEKKRKEEKAKSCKDSSTEDSKKNSNTKKKASNESKTDTTESNSSKKSSKK